MSKTPDKRHEWYLSQTPAQFLRYLRSDLISYSSSIKQSAELISEVLTKDKASEEVVM